MDREQRRARGDETGARLAADGVRAVALTWVDNAGIARVKAVPARRLGQAAAWGVGATPAFDVFCFDDFITGSPEIRGPVGDLRLRPDLDRVTALAALPGWAWAPTDRWGQDDAPHPGCQRMFARRMVEQAAAQGLRFKMAFEVEWFVGLPGGATAEGGAEPACQGPAYGMTRIIELSDYLADLLAALDEQGIAVEQIHPEYALGQLELSVAPADPVNAADDAVLVRQTIRAVSQRHGLLPSFAPVVIPGEVGNGGHLHFSAWQDDADGTARNVFAGGDGPYGITDTGAAIIGGLVRRLPALAVVGNPSPASYQRLRPQQWAGVYPCWGRENREAALRLVTGTVGSEPEAANLEVKCVDQAANPYLLVGAVTAVAAAAVAAATPPPLPAEVTVDPATMSPDDRPRRLPRTLGEAVLTFRDDDLLPAAMGATLAGAVLAVRRADIERYEFQPADRVVAATRWRY